MALQMVINREQAGDIDFMIRSCERVIWMRHALLGQVDDSMREEREWRMELRSGDNTPVLLHLCWDRREKMYNISVGDDFEWVEHVSELHKAFLHLMRDEHTVVQACDALERMRSGLNLCLPIGVWDELDGKDTSCDLSSHEIRERSLRGDLQQLRRGGYVGFLDVMVPCLMPKPHEELPQYIRRPCHKIGVRLVSCACTGE